MLGFKKQSRAEHTEAQRHYAAKLSFIYDHPGCHQRAKELGPGLLETVYQICMVIELKGMGLKVQSEVSLPICYRGQRVHEEGFRIDLLIEDMIIVELKSVEKFKNVHKKQLLTYLRSAKKPLGLLLNFNEAVLKDGITRIINSPHDGI